MVKSEKPKVVLHLILELFRLLIRVRVLREHFQVAALINIEGTVSH